MSKKPFKNTTVGQLLLGAATVINPTLGNILQGVTSPQEAIAEITKSDAPAEDKIKMDSNLFFHIKLIFLEYFKVIYTIISLIWDF